MAAEWSFDPVAEGGLYGENGVGEHWSSDTWDEPPPAYPPTQGSQSLHSSHAPPRHANNDNPLARPAFATIHNRPLHTPHATEARSVHRWSSNHDLASILWPSHDQDLSPANQHPDHDPRFRQRPSQDSGNTESVDPANLQRPQAAVPAGDHSREQHATSNSQVLDSDTDDEGPMAPSHRRHPRNSNGNDLVDLTQSPNMPSASAPQQSRTRKRSSDSSGGNDASANKRAKRAPGSTEGYEEEEVQEEAPSAEEELLQAQQRDALKLQEENKDEGGTRIGKRTCIICLENYTNATTSSCGHIFCHECLTRALMASEKNNDRGVGNCPACRKALSRKKANQVIPINFMKKSAFKNKGRQPHTR